MDDSFERTVDLLRERRDTLEQTARRLLEKETLDEAELRELVPSIESAKRTRARAAQ